MRTTYGNTWWGKKWLNALADIDDSNRLPRGRTYANRGLAREIMVRKNRITAKVSGSRPMPYKVDIKIPPFSAQNKQRLLELVTENPLHLSKLLSRKLPQELFEACQKANIKLFPNSWNDLEGGCSCPDWAVPCKHIAAVVYLVANEIDKNPFLIFELRDFDLFEGLEKIGFVANQHKEIEIPQFKNLLAENEETGRTDFVWEEEIYQSLDFTKIVNCREQLLGIMPAKPPFYPQGDFVKILDKVYQTVSKALVKQKKIGEVDIDHKILAIETVKITIDSDMDFHTFEGFDYRGNTLFTIPDLDELLPWLERIPIRVIDQFSLPMRGLILSYRLAIVLAEHSAMIPELLSVSSDYFAIRWLPASLNEAVGDLVEKVKNLTPGDLITVRFNKENRRLKEAEESPMLLSVFLNALINEHHRLSSREHENAVVRLFFSHSLESFSGFKYRGISDTIRLWLNRFFIAEKDFVPVVKIVEKNDDFAVELAVEDKREALQPLISLWDLFTKKKYADIRMEVLRDFVILADYMPKINQLVGSRGKKELTFSADQFVDILFQILPIIRLFGIKILLPKGMRNILRPKLSLNLEGDSGVVKKSSIISLENMLRFKWQIAIGDQILSKAAFLKKVSELSGIVKLNDQYVFFDQNELHQLVENLDAPPQLSGHEILQAALSEEYNDAGITLDTDAQSMLQEMLSAEACPPPAALKATLRPYQQRGYEWLYKNSRLGLGSLIADDMGLGKTVQVIATILKLKEDGDIGEQKALVIVPTTLLTNWNKEIQKFAPSLKTHIYHGSNRNFKPLAEADVMLTTYGVARSETAKLNKQKWLLLAIDESQNIKNPTTAQSKAIKKIIAPIRIAMSGTPVENRLSEYWSVFDFTNKGYLGNIKKFKEDFAKPIEVERDQKQLQRFRKITSPFILRRVKTDKFIIQDLPDKIEKNQFCQLTKTQVALYQNVLDNTMRSIEEAEGIDRRGLILKLITALKQVCNHPVHFLKKGRKTPEESGKLMMLIGLLSGILEQGDKTLIFTQYQEMGKILVEVLAKELGEEVPFLHGGVSRKGRDTMVEDFQNNRNTRIMILSLKAGGTGLNLTAASNVIHYDLWWNPAVEAQATDRAYRIGQTKNVLVHRFITQATFEERINKLLQEKKKLADLTVATGEKWVGDFSDKELRDLMALE